MDTLVKIDKEQAEELLEFYTPKLNFHEHKAKQIKEFVSQLKDLIDGKPQLKEETRMFSNGNGVWSPSSWPERAIDALAAIGKQCSSGELIDYIIIQEPSIDRKVGVKTLSGTLRPLELSGKIIRKEIAGGQKLNALPEWYENGVLKDQYKQKEKQLFSHFSS